jgi:hypothetical protein
MFKMKMKNYLVKSAGTAAVTKEAIGFLWTSLNISRSSELMLISSFLPQVVNFYFFGLTVSPDSD